MGFLAATNITGKSDRRTMYCPRCDRTAKAEDLERVSKELKERFGRDSLDRAECPVCSTPLIDLSKKKVR
jgi:hypothetical protein